MRYNPLTPELIEKGGRPFLDENKAAHRAKLVVEVATKLRLDWKIQGVPLTNGLWIPIYEIPGSQFGKSDEDDVEECFRAHGVGLNWGGLHRFARACEVGFRLFPKTFPRSFTKKLRSASDHIATVEEICWLDAWHNPTEIVPEFSFPNSSKSVDWRFNSCGLTINLEVKYRPRDWMRRVDGPEYNKVKQGYYRDTHQKFSESRSNEINLVALSSYCEPDYWWRKETESLINSEFNIHGVVMWCPSLSSRLGPFTVVAKNQKLVETLLNRKDEDSQHLVLIRHLWRKSEERREARIDEMLQDISKLHTDNK